LRENRFLRGGRGGSFSGRSSSSSRSSYSSYSRSGVVVYSSFGGYYGSYLNPVYGYYYTYTYGYTDFNGSTSIIVPSVIVPLFVIVFLLAGYFIYKGRRAAQV
jgi:hypothetical protein